MRVLPNFCDAMVLKFCVHQQLKYAYLNKYGYVKTPYSNYHNPELKRMITILDNLRYSQQTDEEYRQCVEKAMKEIEETD